MVTFRRSFGILVSSLWIHRDSSSCSLCSASVTLTLSLIFFRGRTVRSANVWGSPRECLETTWGWSGKWWSPILTLTAAEYILPSFRSSILSVGRLKLHTLPNSTVYSYYMNTNCKAHACSTQKRMNEGDCFFECRLSDLATRKVDMWYSECMLFTFLVEEVCPCMKTPMLCAGTPVQRTGACLCTAFHKMKHWIEALDAYSGILHTPPAVAKRTMLHGR